LGLAKLGIFNIPNAISIDAENQTLIHHKFVSGVLNHDFYQTFVQATPFGEVLAKNTFIFNHIQKCLKIVKGNAISTNKLNANVLNWLRLLEQTLVILEHGHGTIRNYVQEMKLLFKFYYDRDVE